MTPSTLNLHPSSFIESQLPIAPLSAECYKERKAGSEQTLTGMGKWWGRKPLILVRGTLLGLLMPSSDDLHLDREVFLRILTMDEDGLLQRFKGIPNKKLLGDYARESEVAKWRELEAEVKEAKDNETKKEARTAFSEYKRDLAIRVFLRLPYVEKLDYALRPEEIEGPSEASWKVINAHLGTEATTLPELFEQLAVKRFGERAKVGDCFCGGGSIPFEAARMGCAVFASDLNPIACLLTWGALNIIGGGPEKVAEVKAEQERVYAEVERQIGKWGIERSEEGWRAEYYLYCVEVTLPDGWRVPLAPSWVIGQKTRTVAKLVTDYDRRRFDFKIVMGAIDEEMETATQGTARGGDVFNPATGESIKLSVLRGDHRVVVGQDENGRPIKETRNKLRRWEKEDWKPRPNDFYQERLYCIRWRNGDGKAVYREPTEFDLKTEGKVETLLAERFEAWQAEGHIPSKAIEPGQKTSEPVRTRGWTHWHQLFNARALLILGESNKKFSIGLFPSLSRFSTYNAKGSIWDSSSSKEMTVWVFLNQAINTLFNHGLRCFSKAKTSWFAKLKSAKVLGEYHCTPRDARSLNTSSHLWITDPPYADAINYHELSEFFLAWIDKKLPKFFPEWYADSKRALAVTGEDESFEETLAAIYANLREHTLPGGMQVIMFTHSSNEVWLSLTRVIRKAGLQVLAVWAVRTETENAFKGEGNYVKATYLVVLKAREAHAPKPKFQIRGEVVREVERLLGDMDSINQGGELNFKYGDLLLAAPTALLKVMTGYEEIRGLNPLERDRFEAEMLREAEKYRDARLYPEGFDGPTWESLAPSEKFYLMNLHQERKGDTSQELYQLSSKAYGVADYKKLLASKKANEARLMTPLEIRGRAALLRILGENSLTSALVGAIWEAERQDSAEVAHRTLRDELGQLTQETAGTLRTLCRFLAALQNLDHWQRPAHWASEIELGIGRL